MVCKLPPMRAMFPLHTYGCCSASKWEVLKNNRFASSFKI
jgi:hypothetical protein